MSETNNNPNLNNTLSEVKNKNILKRIFEYLQQQLYLNIIRYNKSMQNKLNKDINNYKEEFLKIKIEIIPVENKYGKFINIFHKESYYHLYINDYQEIKRYYITESDNTKTIKIVIDNKFKSLCGLFRNCECIKKISFIQFNRKDIDNMSFLFSGCDFLEEIEYINFYTDNVKDMKYMFSSCSSLKKINFYNFSTNNVIDMSYMFESCSSLEKLDLTSFNTEKVISMKCMFNNCCSLMKIIIYNFIINNKLIDMSKIEKDSHSSDDIDHFSFKTDNVTDMSYMFKGCSSLKELNISNFNTNKVRNIKDMFSGCLKLKKLYLPHFYEDDKVLFKSTWGILYECFSLEHLECSNNFIKEQYNILRKEIEINGKKFN